MIATVIVDYLMLRVDNPHLDLATLESSVIWFLFLVIPGWLIALPFVIFIDKADGWRFWLLVCIGICIGPAVIASLGVYMKLHFPDGTLAPGAIEIVYLATGISTIATAIYLAVLKLCTRQRIQPTT
jgi:hypothetical protein